MALKCNKFMFCDALILIIIKIKYVMTEDKTPCIALYLIICHNFIGILYMHEYIWNIIENPLKDNINEIKDIMILKSKSVFK